MAAHGSDDRQVVPLGQRLAAAVLWRRGARAALSAARQVGQHRGARARARGRVLQQRGT